MSIAFSDFSRAVGSAGSGANVCWGKAHAGRCVHRLGRLFLFLVLIAGLFACRSLSAGGERTPESETTLVKMDEKAAGFKRSYRLHLPMGVPSEDARRLVVVLHGAFSGAGGIEKRTGFSRLADREGFVVVYPNGIGLGGLLRHWNASFCCGRAMKTEVDDVAFVFRVIDDVARQVPIDRDRIYLVGNSNGAMLASLIAATRPERIAAVALVAGTVGAVGTAGEETQRIPAPEAPMPILFLHGKDDETIPFDSSSDASGEDGDFVSSLESASFWADGNGCGESPTRQTSDVEGIDIWRWQHCDDDVEVALFCHRRFGSRLAGPDTPRPEARVVAVERIRRDRRNLALFQEGGFDVGGVKRLSALPDGEKGETVFSHIPTPAFSRDSNTGALAVRYQSSDGPQRLPARSRLLKDHRKRSTPPSGRRYSAGSVTAPATAPGLPLKRTKRTIAGMQIRSRDIGYSR